MQWGGIAAKPPLCAMFPRKLQKDCWTGCGWSTEISSPSIFVTYNHGCSPVLQAIHRVCQLDGAYICVEDTFSFLSDGLSNTDCSRQPRRRDGAYIILKLRIDHVSPDLNPIEEYFGEVKDFMKKEWCKLHNKRAGVVYM